MASSVITIEELTGRRRRLTLRGAALPFRGVGFAAATVVATTWNPGSSEATQQVLSPQELPSDWEGEWNTNRLVPFPAEVTDEQGTRPLAQAFELVEVFDSIRAGAQVLRITWANQIERQAVSPADSPFTAEHRVVRIGRITEFEPRYSTLDDVSWTATFEWISRGRPAPKATDSRSGDLVAAVRAAMLKQAEVTRTIALDRLRAVGRKEGEATTFSLGQLEQMAEAPLAIVDSFARSAEAVTNRLGRLGNLILQVRDTPSAIASRALDVAINAVAVSTQFVDQISRKSPEQLAATNKVGMLLRTASYYGRAQTQAELMATAHLLLAAEARRRRSATSGQADSAQNNMRAGDVLAIHLPRDGETWSKIARRYYGSDLGPELARANGAESYSITPPTRRPVVVPTLSVLENRAARSV